MQAIDDFIQAFLMYLRFEKRYSSHTVQAYATDLRDFRDYLATNYNEVYLKDISYQMVRSWLASLMENSLTAKTINRKLSSLKSFFKYHIKTGAVEQNPMQKIIAPKIRKRLPSFVNEGDMVVLHKRLDTSTEDWKSLNAKLIIEVFYQTGMRLSELINLKEKQVDAGRKQLKITGKGNKERSIPLTNGLLKSIDEYISLKRKTYAALPDELFVTEKGKKLYPKYAYLLVNKYLSTISTLEKRSPHVLRHSFATHLVNQGAELNAVKDLLGHANLAATQIYTHNSIEKLKEVFKKAHPKA